MGRRRVTVEKARRRRRSSVLCQSFALLGFFLSQVDGKASKHFLIETKDAKSSMPETDGKDYGGASPGGGSNNQPQTVMNPDNPPTEIDHCWVCTMDGCHPGRKDWPCCGFHYSDIEKCKKVLTKDLNKPKRL